MTVRNDHRFFYKNPSLRTVAPSSDIHRIKQNRTDGRTDGRTDMTDGQHRTGQDRTEKNGQDGRTVRNDRQI